MVQLPSLSSHGRTFQQALTPWGDALLQPFLSQPLEAGLLDSSTGHFRLHLFKTSRHLTPNTHPSLEAWAPDSSPPPPGPLA